MNFNNKNLVTLNDLVYNQISFERQVSLTDSRLLNIFASLKNDSSYNFCDSF